MWSMGRHISRAIGMSLAWGVAWAGAGILVARVPGLYSDLPFAYQFAPFGILAGITCSGIFSVLEGRHRFDDVSFSRVAWCGAVCGILLAIIIATLRGDRSESLVFAPALALAGAACAAGSLAVLRRSGQASRPNFPGSLTEA